MISTQGNKVLLRTLACSSAMALASWCGHAGAEDYSVTSVQIAHTSTDRNDFVMGTGTADGSRTMLRFEHFGTYSLGDNYLMFDSYQGDALGQGSSDRQNFFVWNSHLSLSKLSGAKLSAGPIQDVLAMVRLEDGSYTNYRAAALGISVYWTLPISPGSMLETSILTRQKRFQFGAGDTKQSGALLRLYLLVPFKLGGLNATVSGPLYYARIAGGGHDIYLEPEFFVSFGPKDAVSAGLRVEHHRVSGDQVINTAGDKSRTTTSLALRWNW